MDYKIESHGEKERMRHGSQTFYNLLEEMAITHDKKSHDYASSENPSGNYHFAGKLALLFAHSEQDAGFIGRLGEKLYRLANLESSQKIAQNESIEDTERDIAVITALWMSDRRDRRSKKQAAIAKVSDQLKQGTWTGFQPAEQYQEAPKPIVGEKNEKNAIDQVISLEPHMSTGVKKQIIDYLMRCVRDDEALFNKRGLASQ